jgi:hypothetical protein
MCGTFSAASAGAMRSDLARDPAETLARPRIRGPRSPASACPRRCRGRGPRTSTASISASSSPSKERRPRRQAGKAPSPGRTMRVARATASGSEVTTTGPRRSRPPCAGTPFRRSAGCPSRSRRGPCRHGLTACPWSRGSRRRGADRAPPPRAGARDGFERRLGDVVAVDPGQPCVTWSVMPPWVESAWKNSRTSSVSKLPIFAVGKSTSQTR